MRGAIREDDGGWWAGQVVADEAEPRDDPYGDFNRFCNHFFDPLYNRRLTDPHAIPVCVTTDTFATAPAWASGAVDPFSATVREDTARRNHFTLYDAREAMWRALTGRDKSFNDLALTPLDRKAYWATAFRALGDVLHLVQDMAQPQHTRNEAHGVGHATHYEKYIDARARGDRQVTLKGLLNVGNVTVAAVPFTALDYGGYPVPGFLHYSRFWSTGTGTASLTGKGLADYSSRGFFTPASNFGNTSYARPRSDMTSYTRQVVVSAGGIKREYLLAPVFDAYIKADSSPIRMTGRGLWDDGLVTAGHGGSPSYSLDLATFDDRAALLIPRAVAYSAGLLDHFFNPRLRIDAPAEGVYALLDTSTAGGFPVVRLKLTNVTPPLSEDGASRPQHLLSGTAVAVVKFHRNRCYRPDLSGEYGSSGRVVTQCRATASGEPMDIDDSAEEIVVSRPISLSLQAGQTVALAFDFAASRVPLDASDVYLQVVYRGAIGPDAATAEPDVVAVTTKDISEPSYFAYFNANDYIHIGSKVYTRPQVVQSQSLLEQVQPRNCISGAVGSRKLNAACLVPERLTMQLAFGDVAMPSIRVAELPSRRFFRVAVLTDGLAAPAKARELGMEGDREANRESGHPARAPLKVVHVASAKANGEKALLYQQSTCLPLDPFDVEGVDNQLRFPDDAPYYHTEGVTTVRGVQGYVQASCVLNGDNSIPGAADNRNKAMSTLSASAGELQPYPVTIDAAFLRP